MKSQSRHSARKSQANGRRSSSGGSGVNSASRPNARRSGGGSSRGSGSASGGRSSPR